MALVSSRRSSRWGISEEISFFVASVSFIATVVIGVMGAVTGSEALLMLAGIMAALVSTCVVVWLCLRSERLRADTWDG